MAARETALIVGVGPGLGSALARLCAAEGMAVAVAARDTGKLEALKAGCGAHVYACDAIQPAAVTALFDRVAADLGGPDLVVYNAAGRLRGPLVDLDPAGVESALKAGAFGGFLVGQAAARRMLKIGHGTILFTGASASIKGFAQSAPFAMGKFALRGLAQSMARELQPRNVHVAHIVIDGGIDKPDRADTRSDKGPDGLLQPDIIARNYLHLHRQHRSAWTSEIELRPWVETF